jgi:hypothetical protein
MSLFRTMAAREKLARIHEIVSLQESGAVSGYVEAARLEVEKWRLILELLQAHPFPTRTHLRRSEQWRDAFGRVREIRDREFCDWILLQVEVAANIERGVREMRPRKPGPCHPQLVEYAAQRLRKAEKILHFAEEGEKSGGVNAVDADWHQRTTEILQKARRKYQPYDHGGHEDIPWPVGSGED